MQTEELSRTIEVSKATNFYLDGVKALRIEYVTTTYPAVRKSNPKTGFIELVSKKPIHEDVETVVFNLYEVSPEMLSVYRKSGVPSFVLKTDGKYYHAEISPDISFLSSDILGAHTCAGIDTVCDRLSYLDDEHGGCQKVRDHSNQGIEKYPWIVKGYQTFNTQFDSFRVVECNHFVSSAPVKGRKKRDEEETPEVRNKKFELALCLWEDIDDIWDARERMEKMGLSFSDGVRKEMAARKLAKKINNK